LLGRLSPANATRGAAHDTTGLSTDESSPFQRCTSGRFPLHRPAAAQDLIRFAVSRYRNVRTVVAHGPKSSRQTASAWALITRSEVGSRPVRRRHSGPRTNIVGPAPVRR